jgi:hypothetical protein
LASVINVAPASAASSAANATTICQAGRVSRSSNSRIPSNTLTAGFATELTEPKAEVQVTQLMASDGKTQQGRLLGNLVASNTSRMTRRH